MLPSWLSELSDPYLGLLILFPVITRYTADAVKWILYHFNHISCGHCFFQELKLRLQKRRPEGGFSRFRLEFGGSTFQPGLMPKRVGFGKSLTKTRDMFFKPVITYPILGRHLSGQPFRRSTWSPSRIVSFSEPSIFLGSTFHSTLR
jgi:hypothetical protein